MRRALLVILLVSAVSPAWAHARDREWRVSVTGSGRVEPVEASSSSADALLAGGGLRYAYGLTHAWEVGAQLDAGYGRSLELAGAMVGVQAGTLWADDLDLTLSAGARYILGIQHSLWFVRTHPVLGVRVGLAGRYLHNQALLTPDGTQCISCTLPDFDDTELQLVPFAGCELGVEHRFGRAFVVGVIASVDVRPGGLAAGATLELSWHWY